jgi:hypothetical protein
MPPVLDPLVARAFREDRPRKTVAHPVRRDALALPDDSLGVSQRIRLLDEQMRMTFALCTREHPMSAHLKCFHEREQQPRSDRPRDLNRLRRVLFTVSSETFVLAFGWWLLVVPRRMPLMPPRAPSLFAPRQPTAVRPEVDVAPNFSRSGHARSVTRGVRRAECDARSATRGVRRAEWGNRRAGAWGYACAGSGDASPGSA